MYTAALWRVEETNGRSLAAGLSANNRKHSAFIIQHLMLDLPVSLHQQMHTSLLPKYQKESDILFHLVGVNQSVSLKVSPGQMDKRMTLRGTFPLKGQSTYVKMYFHILSSLIHNVGTRWLLLCKVRQETQTDLQASEGLCSSRERISLTCWWYWADSLCNHFCWPSFSLPNKFG